MRISYVNGSYLPHEQAFVHIDDRGTDFADGVYEVIAYANRKLVDYAPHMERLKNSLKLMQINLHISFDDLDKIISEIIKRNEFENGLIYLRITRGVSDRYHPFPIGVNPSVVVTTKFWKRPSEADYSNGVSVITFPEIRWAWRHIKSIALLPNVIAKQKSMEANTKEAWFVEKDGTVTEASSSNVFIVKDGVIITHPESESILGGVTRKTLLKMASENGIRVEERKFTISEAFSADEAFMSSTSMGAIAVNKIDDKPIKTGHIAQKLHKLYDEYAGI